MTEAEFDLVCKCAASIEAELAAEGTVHVGDVSRCFT